MKLVIEQGEGAGQIRNLAGPEAIIGRGRESDIVLSEQGVSRQHARLQWESEGWYLIDLGSTNGTRLNDQLLIPHQPRRLQAKDRIMIGGSVLVVSDAEAPKRDREEQASPQGQGRSLLLIAGAILLIVVLVGIVTVLVVALQPQREDQTPTPMNQLDQIITALPVPTEFQDIVTSVVPLITTRLPGFASPEPATPPPPAAGIPADPLRVDRQGAGP